MEAGVTNNNPSRHFVCVASLLNTVKHATQHTPYFKHNTNVGRTSEPGCFQSKGGRTQRQWRLWEGIVEIFP